jgi:uncharacterized delta-60 repeat protein
MERFFEILERRSLLSGVTNVADNSTSGSAYRPDVTFGVDGETQLPFTGPAVLVRQLADGSILTVGTASDGQTGRVAFARFTAAGLPDASFGNNGVVETPILGTSICATLQGKGKIVVLVQQGNEAVVARFNANGTRDKTFSGNGMIDALSLPGPVIQGSIAVGSDGKVVAVGFNGKNVAPFFFRLTTNGILDTTFGGTGEVQLALRPYGVAVQPDNRIVVAGYVGQSSLTATAVARFTTSGALDSTFGIGGYAQMPQPNVAFTRAIVNPDGTILVAGFVHGSFNGSYVTRLSTTGTVVEDYSDSVFNSGQDTLEDIAVDAKTGVIFAVSDDAVQRFAADGTAIDPNFDDTELINGQAAGLTSDGNLLLAGSVGKFASTLTLATPTPRPDLALGANGTLVITGTQSADTIGVTESNGSVRVRRDGVTSLFVAADVKRLDIQGLGGNDVIDWAGTSIPAYCDAGMGNDSVTAGSGDDTITAGAGRDTVRGGAGDDFINGNGGADRLFGDAGIDHILGGDGNDEIVGGAGVDHLFGKAGHDTLIGDSGNDQLNGGSGADRISGGQGTDTGQTDPLDSDISVEIFV